MWIYQPEEVVHAGGDYSIIAARLPWEADNKNGVQITISNSKPAATFGSGSDGVRASVKTSNLLWHHIVGSINGDTSVRYIYVDGDLCGTLKGPLFAGTVVQTFMLGGDSKGLKPFKGSIDDVRIYNRALSAEEVKALYEFEKAE